MRWKRQAISGSVEVATAVEVVGDYHWTSADHSFRATSSAFRWIICPGFACCKLGVGSELSYHSSNDFESFNLEIIISPLDHSKVVSSIICPQTAPNLSGGRRSEQPVSELGALADLGCSPDPPSLFILSIKVAFSV